MVNCLCVADLLRCGNNNLVVGRDDGSLEVYYLDGEQPPVLLFEAQLHESLRSVQCGFVNSADHPEVIVAGYSGRISSFTTEALDQRDHDDNYGRSVAAVQTENRIRLGRKDVEALRIKVEKEKEKLSRYSQQFVPVQQFQVNSTFQLDTQEMSYVLVVELTTPIQLLVLSSNVRLELLDVDSTAAVITRCPISHPEDKLMFAATLRCQEAVRRLSIKIRTTEGIYGTLQMTVVTETTIKAAKVQTYITATDPKFTMQ